MFKLADPPSLRFSDSGASRALLSVAIGLLHANVLGDAADIGVPWLFALPALGALLFVFGFVGIQSSILSILQHRQTPLTPETSHSRIVQGFAQSILDYQFILYSALWHARTTRS